MTVDNINSDVVSLGFKIDNRKEFQIFIDKDMSVRRMKHGLSCQMHTHR